MAAYRELAAEGWVDASVGSGTYVTRQIPAPLRDAHAAPASRATASTLRRERTPSGGPGLDRPTSWLQWDFGVPDPRIAPTRELARAYRRALTTRAQELMAYERYRSNRRAGLPEALCAMLRATRGLDVDPERLVVTRGSQMGLYLLARALVRPGDRVAVEAPGGGPLWNVFRETGARIVPIDVDACGIATASLEAAVREGPLRAVFVTPHHQFPTTVTLSVPRRIELLRLAERERFVVIEDDYDHEFHYDGHPVRPLASGDDAGVVAYVGSLSKLFAPGLRLGYVVCPPPLAAEVRRLRELIDIQGDLVLEAAVAELFEDGEMHRHFHRARKLYRTRRDALVDALRADLGDTLTWRVPSGGMAIWAHVDPAVDVEGWAERAQRRGLTFRTGRIFTYDGKPIPFVRLGFARLDEAEVEAAVATLKASL